METGYHNTIITGSRPWESLKCPIGCEQTRIEPMLLQCEVMFGSPSSNCDGNGICKIVARNQHPLQPFNRTSCSHAKAMFTTCDGGKGASMIFRREWLCSKLMRQHFRHGVLEMPESCPIPPALISLLGLPFTELPAGLHLIEHYETYYRINFRFTHLI